MEFLNMEVTVNEAFGITLEEIGLDTDKHGTRLDVYIEEDGETGTIYDVEPDKNDDRELRRALPRRVRFYHSKIDGRSLSSGDDYSK